MKRFSRIHCTGEGSGSFIRGCYRIGLLSVVWIFSACRFVCLLLLVGQVADAQGETVGVILTDLKYDYTRRILEGVREAAQKEKITVLTASYTSELYVSAMIDAFVAQGADGILLVATSGSDVFARAMGPSRVGKTPIVTIGYEIPNATASVIMDARSVGTLQGQLVESVSGHSGTLLYLGGAPWGPYNTETRQAFELELSPYSFKVVYLPILLPSRDSGEDETREAISLHADLRGIVAITDSLALGAADAVRFAGLSAKVPVVGTGATPEGTAAVLTGELYATIDLRPAVQGKSAFRMLMEALHPDRGKRRCDNGSTSPCVRLIQGGVVRGHD